MAPTRRDLFKTTSSLPSNAKKLKARKRTPIEFVGHLFVALLALFVCAVLLLRADFLQIREVAVQGAVTVDGLQAEMIAREQLEEFYFFLVPRTNVLLYPRAQIQELLLARFPRLASVELEVDAARTLSISLREREMAYVVCSGENFAQPCYAVEADGYIFDTAPLFSGELYPLFQISGTSSAKSAIGTVFLSQDELSRTTLALERFREVLGEKGYTKPLSGVQSLGMRDYAIPVGSGKLLFREGTPSELAEALRLVFASPAFAAGDALSRIETLDLRFGKKVYFTFQDDLDRTASSTDE